MRRVKKEKRAKVKGRHAFLKTWFFWSLAKYISYKSTEQGKDNKLSDSRLRHSKIISQSQETER